MRGLLVLPLLLTSCSDSTDLDELMEDQELIEREVDARATEIRRGAQAEVVEINKEADDQISTNSTAAQDARKADADTN